ncbi:MAG: hypothetical protein ABIY55_02465, partial [Kofleriaceae bacterium]
MATTDADLWHQVHAQREDGVPAMFLIRDVEPRRDQPQIFVIELPYPITELSKLPDAAGYRRLDTFQEQWVEPACEALGWTFVAWKSEDGSFFLYLYGDGDANAMLEKLAPFDAALGFFNDVDADWSEYTSFRELVEQAEQAPEGDDDDSDGHVHSADCDHDHDGEDGEEPAQLSLAIAGAKPAGKRAKANGKADKSALAKAGSFMANAAKGVAKAAKAAAKAVSNAVTSSPAKSSAKSAKSAGNAAKPTGKAALAAAQAASKSTSKPLA